MSRFSDPDPALVMAGGRSWPVATGAVLTFGRSVDRDLRLGHEPVEDDFVSRHAGTLLGIPNGVLVRNDSATQSLTLQALPGPEFVVGPGMAVATTPHPRTRVIVPGRFGWQYSFTIDTRGLVARTPAPEVPTPAHRATRGGAGKITDRELRMLAALCEPLLTQAGGGAAPATYREIGKRVGTTPQTARNCLDLLRARLSDVDGIPGLRADEDSAVGGSPDFRAALARWSVGSRTVTVAELALLPGRSADDRAADPG